MQKTCAIKIIAVSLYRKIKARTSINILNAKKMKDFVKTINSLDVLNYKIKELESIYKELLPSNYQLINVQGSITNGLSLYVKIIKDGKDKPFVIRISDHRNGASMFGVEDFTLQYQMNGTNDHFNNVNDMLVFYGDMSRKEARRIFLEYSIKEYRDKGYSDESIQISGLLKQLKELK